MQTPKGWKPPLPAKEVDRFLELWVYWANTLGFEVDVTLHVSGSLIQGTITSYAAWVDSLAEGMKAGKTQTPETRASVVEAMEKLRDDIRDSNARNAEEQSIAYTLAQAELEELGGDPSEAEIPEREISRYIHLKDVTIQQGTLYFEPGIFRIDMRSVDGWVLGTFNA